MDSIAFDVENEKHFFPEYRNFSGGIRLAVF